MFKENAGHMRGFRIARDPDGILFSPFDYAGTKMGYVITYGEGVPAVHDGTDWVVVIDDEKALTFEDDLQGLIVQQATAIAAGMSNPVYAELGAQMGMYAQAAAPAVTDDPASSAQVFGV
jgi:hypothetical protein